MIRYRALRTLERVAGPPAQLAAAALGASEQREARGGGCSRSSAHGIVLGEVEEGLMQAMHAHEDDDLVFLGAFSALCRRLGVRVRRTRLYGEEHRGAGGKARGGSAQRRGAGARGPGRGEGGEWGDGQVEESLESLEFQHLELLSEGGGGDGRDELQGESEEAALAVRVLQAWLDERVRSNLHACCRLLHARHFRQSHVVSLASDMRSGVQEANREKRASPADGTYGGGAKERLMDLKMRRAAEAMQTQHE